MKSSMVKKCQHCKCVKPPRSHHCSTCDRCVLKMDHHCPWMNNCIGLRNQKAFLLFNFYTCITAAWTSCRVVYAMIDCSGIEECDTFNTGIVAFSVGVVILCGIFALFTCIMFCDQASMIRDDTSTIDRMQAARAAKKNAQAGDEKRSASVNKTSESSCSWYSVLFFLPCSFG